MNWTPLNLTVRVGCNLAYESSVPTPVLFVLKPPLEGRVLVMQEKLSFVIGPPFYEFRYSYSAAVSAGRPATDYAARVMPHRDGVPVPLEAAQILWQR